MSLAINQLRGFFDIFGNQLNAMFLIFLLGLLITVYIFNKVYFGKTTRDAIEKEIAKTRKIYEKQIPTMIPWNRKDMELLSYFLTEKSERKGFGYSFRGIFTSIYQEKMLIFQRKIPFGKSKNGFTVVMTKNHDILYDAKNNVYVNGEHLGIIDKKGRFANPKLRRVFGFLGEQRYSQMEVINEEKKILGSVKIPEDWELPFPRAIEVYEDLEPQDLVTFKVLACYKMIDIYLNHHKKD